jgi:DNA-binding MarR family transcriptional regulator
MFDPELSYGQLPFLTGFALRRASILDFALFGDAVGDRAITPLRYSVLEIVGANPGIQQVRLADTLGLSKPAATLAIDFWEARGHVARRRNGQDRRAYGVELTGAGETALRELRIRVAEHDRTLTQWLSKDDLATLQKLLARIYMR